MYQTFQCIKRQSKQFCVALSKVNFKCAASQLAREWFNNKSYSNNLLCEKISFSYGKRLIEKLLLVQQRLTDISLVAQIGLEIWTSSVQLNQVKIHLNWLKYLMAKISFLYVNRFEGVFKLVPWWFKDTFLAKSFNKSAFICVLNLLYYWRLLSWFMYRPLNWFHSGVISLFPNIVGFPLNLRLVFFFTIGDKS